MIEVAQLRPLVPKLQALPRTEGVQRQNPHRRSENNSPHRQNHRRRKKPAVEKCWFIFPTGRTEADTCWRRRLYQSSVQTGEITAKGYRWRDNPKIPGLVDGKQSSKQTTTCTIRKQQRHRGLFQRSTGDSTALQVWTATVPRVTYWIGVATTDGGGDRPTRG